MARPLIDFPVCFHSIYQMRAAVLYGDGVAMIVVPEAPVRPTLWLCSEWDGLHVCKQVNSVCIVIDRRITDNTQCMQLVAKSSFADDELSGVSSVETVNTVSPCYPVLHA